MRLKVAFKLQEAHLQNYIYSSRQCTLITNIEMSFKQKNVLKIWRHKVNGCSHFQCYAKKLNMARQHKDRKQLWLYLKYISQQEQHRCQQPVTLRLFIDTFEVSLNDTYQLNDVKSINKN